MVACFFYISPQLFSFLIAKTIILEIAHRIFNRFMENNFI